MKRLIIFAFLAFPFLLKGHDITSTSTGGAWSTASTWVGAVVPGTNDTATIATTTGHSVTVGAITVLKLTVNSGATLSVNGGASFFCSSLLTNSGAITGTGYLLLKGSGTVVTGSGDWSGYQGNLSFAGSNQVIDASVNIVKSVGPVVLNTVNAGGKVKVTNNGTVKLSDPVAGQITNNSSTPSTWINAANSYLEVSASSWPLSSDTLYASATGNTIVYAGTSAMYIKTPVGKAYYDLTITGSNYISLSSTLSGYSLVVNSGSILNMSADTLSLSNNWTNSGTIINHQANLIDTAVIKLSGTIVDKIPATWLKITSTAVGGYWGAPSAWISELIPSYEDTVIIATTSCNNVYSSINVTVYNLIVNSNAKYSQVSDVMSIKGKLTNNGIINGSSQIYLLGTGTVLAGSGTWDSACGYPGFLGQLYFANNPQVIDASVNYNPSQGGGGKIILYNSTTAVKVTNNGTVNLKDATDGYIADYSSTAHPTTWINGSNAVLVVSNSSFANSHDTLYASATGNTIMYAGTAAYNVKNPVGGNYYNLTIGTTNTLSLPAAINVNNNLSILHGTLNCQTYQITGNVLGNMTMSSSASLLLGLTTSTTAVSFPLNFTSLNTSLNSASTVTYQANTSSQVISSIPTYGNLIISTGSTSVAKTPSGTPLSIGGNLTINSNVTLSETSNTINLTGSLTNSGVLSFSSGALNIGGNFTNNGTFTYGTSITTFDGSSGQSIGGTSYPTFYNLTISGGGSQIVSLGHKQTIIDSLKIISGSLDATASNYSLLIGGNFNASGGSFTPHGDTVTMNGGTQNLGGSVTLSLNTLVLGNGSTTEAATLKGNIVTASNITISTHATLNASSHTMTTAGNFIDNGTFTPSTSTVYFDNNGHQCIEGSASPVTFQNMTLGALSILGNTTSVTLNGTVLVLPGGQIACSCAH